MLINNRLRDGEPKASAFSPAGDHRIKDMFAQRFWNPRPIVFYLGTQHQPVPFLANGKLALYPRTQMNDAAFYYRLHGIAHDVQHRLNELFGISRDLGYTWIIISLNNNALRDLGQNKAADALEDLMDVGWSFSEWPTRANQAIDQITQAIGLMNNNAGVIFQTLVGQFAFQQLGGPA